MGLDMYLQASEYVSKNDYSGDEIEANPLFAQIAEQFGVTDQLDKTGFAGLSIEFPMGYWRKANQIHDWFVRNVQDGEDNCGTYYVSTEMLEVLKSDCLEVLTDNSKAEDLLPTGAGFFFGSTDYDEFYFQDLKNTVEIIDRCLNSKFDSFQYQSSW